MSTAGVLFALSTHAGRMLPRATCPAHINGGNKLALFLLFYLPRQSYILWLSPALLLLAASTEGVLKRVGY